MNPVDVGTVVVGVVVVDAEKVAVDVAVEVEVTVSVSNSVVVEPECQEYKSSATSKADTRDKRLTEDICDLRKCRH